MSEMFNVLYDDIFMNDISTVQENERLNDITNKYIKGEAKIEDKKFLISLRREYLKVQGIKNYKVVQGKLYTNKNRKEIVSFEIERILKKADSNDKVVEQVNDINKLLSMCDGTLSDDLYSKIVNLIIRIEISLGMKIGLFDELCCFFESEIEKIAEQTELVGVKSSYTKKM